MGCLGPSSFLLRIRSSYLVQMKFGSNYSRLPKLVHAHLSFLDFRRGYSDGFGMVRLAISWKEWAFLFWFENFLNRISFLLNGLCASATHGLSTFQNIQNFCHPTIIRDDRLIWRWGSMVFPCQADIFPCMLIFQHRKVRCSNISLTWKNHGSSSSNEPIITNNCRMTNLLDVLESRESVRCTRKQTV